MFCYCPIISKHCGVGPVFSALNALSESHCDLCALIKKSSQSEFAVKSSWVNNIGHRHTDLATPGDARQRLKIGRVTVAGGGQ